MCTASLGSVDKLTVTFLVDNSIEWFDHPNTCIPLRRLNDDSNRMTKLPPGFTHELSQHIRYHSPVVDETTGVPILNFDYFCCGAHGFSALIETHIDAGETHLTLFDTGPDSQSLVRNISAMHVPIESIERVVISHWHSDHTGGLLSFLASRESACEIDVHPDRPSARGIAPGPFWLYVWVSGEIPRVTEFEAGMLGGMRWHIMDERYAAVDVAGKGLVIFSACSHAGIVNVIKDAITTFSRPIYIIIGGLHLAGPEFAPRLPPTIEFLSRQLRPSPTYILPMHCSGFHSKVALEAEFGEGCVPAGVGLKVEIIGDRKSTSELFPPVY
ncbi:beta-lactamase-like protein [Infundibulicybe gibba]|nr:beta-lactamase-like protein [Infundibulicybe gibba]